MNGFEDSSHSQIIILTHRRAAVVALMPAFSNDVREGESSRWSAVAKVLSLPPPLADANKACEGFSNLLQTEPEPQNGFQLFSDCIHYAVAFGETTTAEVLSKMYNAVLSSCARGDGDIKNLSVGVGPGSFTGLRLGCAFANGLQIGRKRQLFALSNLLLKDLAVASQAMPFPSPFWDKPLPVVGDDEFAVPVTLMDFLYALLGWSCAQTVDVLHPAYGRLPGPVLKLQGL